MASHAFLRGLETSGCVGPSSGWQPMHLVVLDDGDVAALQVSGDPDDPTLTLRPIAAAPCYAKGNSWGEYVFDWQWAEVFAQQGKAYYPKLVVGIPFTPATGPRLLVPAGDEPENATLPATLRAMLAAGVVGLARRVGASSVHALFLEADDVQALLAAGFSERYTLQHKFHNRDAEGAPFKDVDDWLGQMRSSARKSVRRERRIASGHGLALEVCAGDALSAADWDAVFALYAFGCERYGSKPYLNRAFFDVLAGPLAPSVCTTLARDGDGEVVAATLNFRGRGALFGRYWGAVEEWPMLHFEMAYYLPIEFAIAHGCTRFEAGSGGGHKLRRGLEPTLCRSAHLVFDAELGPAIAAWLGRERSQLERLRVELIAQGTGRRDA